MTFELITTIALLCSLGGVGGNGTHTQQERLAITHQAQLACQVWYIDCTYEEAGTLQVETSSKQIGPTTLRKCIQKKYREQTTTTPQ